MDANNNQQSSQIANALSQLKEDGWCIIPDVLNAEETKTAVEQLWKAVEEFKRRGEDTFKDFIDPNASNVRVFYLLELDKYFRDLIQHPTAISMVKGVFGANFIISNFTANIARPGSKSMGLHSDQSLMCPDPWLAPWNLNVMWCLSDLYFENGLVAQCYTPD